MGLRCACVRAQRERGREADGETGRQAGDRQMQKEQAAPGKPDVRATRSLIRPL